MMPVMATTKTAALNTPSSPAALPRQICQAAAAIASSSVSAYTHSVGPGGRPARSPPRSVASTENRLPQQEVITSALRLPKYSHCSPKLSATAGSSTATISTNLRRVSG